MRAWTRDECPPQARIFLLAVAYPPAAWLPMSPFRNRTLTASLLSSFIEGLTCGL